MTHPARIACPEAGIETHSGSPAALWWHTRIAYPEAEMETHSGSPAALWWHISGWSKVSNYPMPFWLAHLADRADVPGDLKRRFEQPTKFPEHCKDFGYSMAAGEFTSFVTGDWSKALWVVFHAGDERGVFAHYVVIIKMAGVSSFIFVQQQDFAAFCCDKLPALAAMMENCAGVL